MSKIADSLVSDMAMTVRFYTNRTQPDPELEELTIVATHMLEALSCLRRNQIMRASIRDGEIRLRETVVAEAH